MTIVSHGFATEGETAAELKQQIAKVQEKTSFQLALRKRISQGQKIEVVRDRAGSAAPYLSPAAADFA
jgi:hypothetical protein